MMLEIVLEEEEMRHGMRCPGFNGERVTWYFIDANLTVDIPPPIEI